MKDDLVGGGPSKLGPVAAMRARDVSRPGQEELAEAERTVRVSRRARREETTQAGGAGSTPDRS